MLEYHYFRYIKIKYKKSMIKFVICLESAKINFKLNMILSVMQLYSRLNDKRTINDTHIIKEKYVIQFNEH